MAKKKIKKSRKKSYLKRISRRTMRRSIRRRDKRNYRRKIKKTRKNKRGGAKTVGLTGLTPRNAELVSAGKYVKPELEPTPQPEPEPELQSKNLFGDSRSVNVLETLYGGDPVEISKKIEAYNEKKRALWNEIWGDFDFESASEVEEENKTKEEDRKNSEILNEEFPSGYPTYILISGHGNMLNCTDLSASPCFTLLPRGYKLILSTETGRDLAYLPGIGEWSGPETQLDPTYYRMYEGLIPNQVISFNMVYLDDTGELIEKKTKTHARGWPKGTGYVSMDLPGVCLTGVKSGIISVGGGREKFNHFVNFQSTEPYLSNGIKLEIANKIKENKASPEEINQYATKFVEKLTPLPTTPILEDRFNAYSYYSFLSKEKIKEQIVNSVTPGYSGTFAFFLLSQLLKHIEEEGKTNVNVPKVIVGSFCRSGEWDFNIDGIRRVCPELKEEYFSGEIHYEGVSPELRRGISLASKTKPQDFWGIYDNIASQIQIFDETTQGKFETIRQKIGRVSAQKMEGWGDVYKGINLTLSDVCLIFQMDQALILRNK